MVGVHVWHLFDRLRTHTVDGCPCLTGYTGGEKHIYRKIGNKRQAGVWGEKDNNTEGAIIKHSEELLLLEIHNGKA